MSGFVFREHLKTHDAIALVRGTKKNSTRIYAYLRMSAAQLSAYERAVKLEKPIDFSNFGEVLANGEGQPDAKTKAFMRKRYGFIHEGEA